MSRPSKGARLRLLGFDQDLIERVLDFREASDEAKEQTVIANAVRAYITVQIGENAGIRLRYAAARERRGKPL
jgi:hypothetical protein